MLFLVVAGFRAVVLRAGAFAGDAVLADVFRVLLLLAAALLRVVVAAAFFGAAALRVVALFAAVFLAGALAALFFAVEPLFALEPALVVLRVLAVFAVVLRAVFAVDAFRVEVLAVAAFRVAALAGALRAVDFGAAFAVFRPPARTAMACACGRPAMVSSVLTSKLLCACRYCLERGLKAGAARARHAPLFASMRWPAAKRIRNMGHAAWSCSRRTARPASRGLTLVLNTMPSAEHDASTDQDANAEHA